MTINALLWNSCMLMLIYLNSVFTMVYCAAWGCSNRSEKGVHMYGFPKDRDRRRAWLAKVGRSNFAVTDKDFNNKKICEAHFEADQFVKTRKGKTRLRKDAIPTIFAHRPVVKRRKAPTSRCPPSPPKTVFISADHSYCTKDDTDSALFHSTKAADMQHHRQDSRTLNEPSLMASTEASQMSSLKGKVTLITGASSGIGAGTSVLFARFGALLALNGRDVDNLSKVAQQCTACGASEPLLVPGDLTDEDTVRKAVEQTVAHFGRLDVLVNSAGILAMGSIETADLAQYDKVMNVNVRSVYHLTQLCVPHLIKTKGSIVNVSSITGQRSFPDVLPYCMSKAAIDQFTSCVALELAPKQVRVNSVCPGVIVTEVHKRAGLDEQQYAKFLEKCKQTHALGRPGEVSEVAQAIAFLASDSSSFITGVNLPVDGGRHAMCPR